MNFRLQHPALLTLSALLVMLAQPALAHHVMGGAMPANWRQGLLSGLGHPVIGFDHFAAIVAAGFIASRRPRGGLMVGLYITAMIAGAATHVQGITLPGSEILVAVSLLALGVAMQLRLATAIASVLFAAAGFVNGYALGETIAGAEASPLVFYFAGLAIIQTAVALAAMRLAQIFLSGDQAPIAFGMRIASAAVIAGGAVLLLVDILPRA